MRLPDHNSPPWSRTTKAIVSSAALIVTALAIWKFRTLIAPIVTAMILAYLLNPVVNFLYRRTGLSRGRSILLVYLVIILIFVIIINSINVIIIVISMAKTLCLSIKTKFV